MTKKRQQTSGLPKTTPPKQPEPTEQQKSGARSPLNSLLGRTTQEYRSRAEREAEVQSIVIVGTAAAIVIVAVILVIAIGYDVLYRPNQLAATVNNQNITIADFQKRVRMERAFLIERLNAAINNQVAATGASPDEAFNQLAQQNAAVSRWWDELRFPDQMGLRVLDDMVDDRFILAEAEARGITVSEEAIDARINEFIGYDPEEIALIGTEPTATPSPTITPTPFVSPTPSPLPSETPTETPTATAEADGESTVEATATTEAETSPTAFPTFTAVPTSTPAPTLSQEEVAKNFEDFRSEFLANIRSKANVSDADVREFFRNLAYREALGEALAGDTENGLFVDFREILVLTEEEAQDILSALEAGESFADLARAVSQDDVAASGGEVGLRGIFELPEEIANALRDAAVGETIGPVETENGFAILQLRAKETKELSELQTDTVIGRAITEWIAQQREENASAFQTFDTWTENVPDSPIFVYEPLQ